MSFAVSRAREPEAGASLIEAVVALGLSLALAAGLFTLVAPVQSLTRSLPELADVSQRMRYGFNRLHRDLRDVGYGLDDQSTIAPSGVWLPVLVPYRLGLRAPSAPHRAAGSSSLSLLRRAAGSSSRLTASLVDGPSPEVALEPRPGCGPTCGYGVGDLVLISDDQGRWEIFRVRGRAASSLSLDRLHPTRTAFAPGARVRRVHLDHYYRDAARDQLRHYDGWRADFPLVEGVAAFRIRLLAVQVASSEPCQSTSGDAVHALVELEWSALGDGPWCGPAEHPRDADLRRVRAVHVTLRMQAGDAYRGRDPRLFAMPGRVALAHHQVPDLTLGFRVTPPNLGGP